MPRRCCCSRRTCCYVTGVSFLLFWAAIAYVACTFFFKLVLPIRRAQYLEKDYLRQLKYADFQDGIQEVLANLPNSTQSLYISRIQPLIQDAKQLHYWPIDRSGSPIDAAFGGVWTKLYDELLGLHFDGTGIEACAGNEYWIYLGGTAASETSQEKAEETLEDPIMFQHRYRKHLCSDPEYICDMYNEAFDRVSQRWHGIQGSLTAAGGTSRAKLRFADCDISPLLCDSRWLGLNQDAVRLLHMKIGNECEHSVGFPRCPVTWRILGLPIYEAPWTRQIRIQLDSGGSTVVPAFPDAEEQLWSLMAYAGAEDGIGYGTPFNDGDDTPNYIITTTPKEGTWPEDPVIFGINQWGAWRYSWNKALYHDDWPRELLVKCYVIYYIDKFLQWWDGEPQAVWPRACDGVEEEREAGRRMNQAWIDVNTKLYKEEEAWKKEFRNAREQQNTADYSNLWDPEGDNDDAGSQSE